MKEAPLPTAPDFSLDTVRLLAWTTLALVLMLVLSLVLLRWQRWRNAPRQAAFKAQWTALLMRCALGDDLSGQLPALKPKEHWAFLKLWLHCQMSLKGISRDRLATLGQAMGCQSLAMRKLTSQHAAERLMAILALGFLKDAQAQPALIEQLQQASTQTALHAGRALLDINASAHADRVVQALLARDHLELSLVSVLFKPFKTQLGQALMAQMNDSPQEPKVHTVAPARSLAWLRLARALSLHVPSQQLASCLAATDDIDLLIAAIRLMQDGQNTEALTAHAHHKDWRVRAQVALVLGRTGGHRDIDLLVQLTTDAQWWVRYRAMQSLLRIPGLPLQQIQAWVDRTGDSYAVNMLHSVLSEQRGNA